MSKPTDRAFPLLNKSQWLISLAMLTMLLLALTAKGEMKPASSFSAASDCLIGPTILISRASQASVPQGTPAIPIAYNSQGNEYLAVWQSKESNIYGQVVSYTGDVPAERYFFTHARAAQQFPALACNNDENNCQYQYLVVWQDSRNLNLDIYGQLISCTPEAMGTPFPFSSPYLRRAKDQLHPAVAYNSEADEYLVVWQDKLCPSSYYTVNDIYGWIVDSKGNLEGNNAIPISIATDCKQNGDDSAQLDPAVAYNSQNNQYLSRFKNSGGA